MDTNNFIVYIKAEEISIDIGTNVETRFDTSNYELEKKTKKFVELLKDELVGKQGKNMDEQALKKIREELGETVEKSDLDQRIEIGHLKKIRTKVRQFS